MQKVVAFVPMKLNNERLPGKNTRLLSGKPMCQYIFEALLGAEGIDEIYAYCSDPRIQEYIPDGIRYLPRSTSLDSSSTSILEVCKAFMRDVDADIYLLTHATAPFISSESLSRGVRQILTGDHDSALGVKKIQSFLWQNGVPMNFSPDHVPRTQDLTPIFEETCGIYLWRREVMLQSSRRTGEKPYFIELPEVETIDVDTPEDFVFAELIKKAL